MRAEIVFRLNQPAPEVLLPETIDCDAGAERVGRINDPPREIKAVGGRSVKRWSVGASER